MKSFCEGPEIVLPKPDENANGRVNQKVSAEMLHELSVLHNSNLSTFFHSRPQQNH